MEYTCENKTLVYSLRGSPKRCQSERWAILARGNDKLSIHVFFSTGSLAAGGIRLASIDANPSFDMLCLDA